MSVFLFQVSPWIRAYIHIAHIPYIIEIDLKVSHHIHNTDPVMPAKHNTSFRLHTIHGSGSRLLSSFTNTYLLQHALTGIGRELF